MATPTSEVVAQSSVVFFANPHPGVRVPKSATQDCEKTSDSQRVEVLNTALMFNISPDSLGLVLSDSNACA